jgi:futalosine hydrolase
MWRKVIPIQPEKHTLARPDVSKTGRCAESFQTEILLLTGKCEICSEFLFMNYLLAAATAKEIAPFLDHYRNSGQPAFAGRNLDVLITGIGLTATTYSLTRHFSLKRPGLVIQAGVAGCFDKNIPLGTVVTVKQDRIADEGVVEMKKLQTLSSLDLVSPDQFPYKKGWLVNPGKEIIKKNKLKPVKAISVNQISTDKQMIRLYETSFQPVIETMEGAALHYVCLSEKIPFLQLRGISNYTGERNKTKWNMKDAISNLNKELIRLLESL